ncbi:isopentenyl-diphosphate Delta-isomerase [Gulosibacter macacae]|uniref:Isopentenyl-diphosphate Delta-isomerase n=1 Tax=Gulosibacter macacae TaxID=2488791 RepID=A0A3P3VUA6_9MICO|nr:isopentenyl-diphosphate Delta-isomerase [Gulosibacter macacae]RRJ85568.1 isopentenyl-diphosphate Delta-isomerase [Gulosibacter macacae]
MASSPELVVLVDHTGAPIGTRLKSDVHDENTPLHLASSCYLFDEHGRVLVTRRALTKKTWPGVWTNSFCGHPGPDESFNEAIMRRADQELGVEIVAIRGEIPTFSYRAVDASGIVENEICPVFTAHTTGVLAPVPEEVCDWQWVTPGTLVEAVTAAPYAFSPWMREQLPQLHQLGALLGGHRNV